MDVYIGSILCLQAVICFDARLAICPLGQQMELWSLSSFLCTLYPQLTKRSRHARYAQSLAKYLSIIFSPQSDSPISLPAVWLSHLECDKR
jgi:hypothetical protein